MSQEITSTDAATRRDRRDRGNRSRRRGVALFFRDLLIIFVAAIVISVGVKTFLVRSFYIPSTSMENTLQVNDRIIVNQLVPGLVPLAHGDVVVFKDPGGWLAPMVAPERSPFVEAIDWVLAAIGLIAPDSNDHLIKRVIGLPGDTVECCNALGQLSINGVAINEPYLKPQGGETRASRDDFKVTVPKDRLWVLGDNRNNSCDSRCNVAGPSLGFVPVENVVGRAVVISWPVARWTWLDNYPQVFDGVEGESPAASAR